MSSDILALPVSRRGAPVFFARAELSAILGVYGRMVALGEWRDYAIASDGDHAVFAVMRRTGDAPAFCIEKHPRLSARQGAWLVRGEGGMVLKRGHELAQVLKVFDTRRFRLVP